MRLPDWPDRLNEYLRGASERPFQWGGENGGQDCALFVAACVQAMTGMDFAAPFRGRYRTRIGAAKVLKKYGGLENFVTAHGLPEVQPAFAQRGDVCLVHDEEGPALGICIGAKAMFFYRGELTPIAMGRVARAWRV